MGIEMKKSLSEKIKLGQVDYLKSKAQYYSQIGKKITELRKEGLTYESIGIKLKISADTACRIDKKIGKAFKYVN